MCVCVHGSVCVSRQEATVHLKGDVCVCVCQEATVYESLLGNDCFIMQSEAVLNCSLTLGEADCQRKTENRTSVGGERERERNRKREIQPSTSTV